ncbi:MAG: DUF6931 family protein [Succinivibrionaceae bacterium]
MKFKKIQDETVENILKTYEASPEILKVVNPQMSPDQFLQAAIDNKLYVDAVTFLAHALPLRESIYWAWLTISFLRNKFKNPKDLDVINSVQEWFTNPDDTTRRINGTLADELKLATGPAWLAEAVFWSGGSILQPKDPITEPPQYLYAKAVTGAICLGISLDEEDSKVVTENYIKSLKIAFNIAQGGNGQIY